MTELDSAEKEDRPQCGQNLETRKDFGKARHSVYMSSFNCTLQVYRSLSSTNEVNINVMSYNIYVAVKITITIPTV